MRRRPKADRRRNHYSRKLREIALLNEGKVHTPQPNRNATRKGKARFDWRNHSTRDE